MTRIAQKYNLGFHRMEQLCTFALKQSPHLAGAQNDRASSTAVGGTSDAEARATVSDLRSLLSAFNVDVGHQGWKAHPPLQVRQLRPAHLG